MSVFEFWSIAGNILSSPCDLTIDDFVNQGVVNDTPCCYIFLISNVSINYLTIGKVKKLGVLRVF